MNGKNLANALKFNYDCVFYNPIEAVAAIQAFIFVPQWYGNLSLKFQLSEGEFMTKTLLVYFFKQTRPNSFMHFNSSSYDLLCEFLINQFCSRSRSFA